MPQPKREGRNDAEWTPEDFTASRNLLRLWRRKAPDLHLSQNKLSRQWGISQGDLLHPTTRQPQPYPPNAFLHNISGIIPAENL